MHGPATGAGIWLAGAIGMAAGIGFWQTVLLATVLALIALSLLRLARNDIRHE